MKQKLFKVLFVCMAVAFLPQVAHAAGDVKINATNFPDDNFRNYLLEQDYGEDGILTEDEIKGVEEMYVGYRDIHSLQGIEYFTALTELYCSDNRLTVLDVSKNIALTYLDCQDNRLTVLDVSKNTALKYLYCYKNQLTALDVSKNTALIALSCYDNQLTALDISKNTALTELYCSNNHLTSLDVSKNTALTRLSCNNNQLTALDVSKNTALAKLYCYNNQLTALDVSKNTALTGLSCYCNQIKGASMDNLIKSLPTVNNCPLRVYSSLASNEGNVCTKEQVKAAKEKGWKAYYEYDCNEFGNGLQKEYEGSDDTAIDGIRTEVGKDAPIYICEAIV